MTNYLDQVNIGFTRQNKNGITYYTVPMFEQHNIIYAFCNQLVFSTIRGATKEQIIENYKTMGEILGFDYKKCVANYANHGTITLAVNSLDAGKGIVLQEKMPRCDGLMTIEKGLPIASTHADCMPIAFFDPINTAISVIHSGWRGILDGAGIQAIKNMTKTYGSQPKDILCSLGPSILSCCFEIDKDLTQEFINKLGYDDFVISGTQKDHIDLQSIILKQLFDIGITKSNITTANVCTCCNNKEFHSYRHDKQKAGAMAQIMMIK